MPDAREVARYTRRIGADVQRVWENVRDWEHLPWLHRASFRAIALEDEGAWGWRARIGLANGREIRLELAIEGAHYVSRTLAGDGAGTEIWTSVRAVDGAQTDIEVAFLAPGVAADAAPKLGAAFVRLYTRLWDEDEAMMQRRAALLARRAELFGPLPADAPPLDLGPAADARARAPFDALFERRPLRVARRGDALVAYSRVCPHWLGPLEDAPDGTLVCPWHGYRFDIADGRGCGTHARLRLLPAPRIEIRADGHAWLVGTRTA